MGETNVELARRGYEAVSRGELEPIADLLADDVRWHGGDPSAPGACDGRAQVLARMRAAIKGGAVGELVDVIDAGERVVVIMRPVAEDEGAEAAPVANLSTFRDGKVVEMIHYPDPAEALAAAGLG
ncbi:MAG: nuclear transport factor 2 family protein [Actinobacteria bacterium]|nr:nuclear transport factor 2 family protein [Actinomycetota bacterium]